MCLGKRIEGANTQFEGTARVSRSPRQVGPYSIVVPLTLIDNTGEVFAYADTFIHGLDAREASKKFVPGDLFEVKGEVTPGSELPNGKVVNKTLLISNAKRKYIVPRGTLPVDDGIISAAAPR